MSRSTSPRWAEYAAALIVVGFAMALVVRPLPNLDLWWLLAVGRRIAETHAYIYRDPFSFTAAGAPWSPQSYASAILFFLLHRVGGMGAITVLRVALVGAIAALTLRTLRALGAAWAISAPLVIVALVTSHSRFTDRGQLFEYVGIAWLVGFLLTSHDRRGKSFFIAPALVQLAWVQLHSSFLLGPMLVALFFASEWVATRVPGLRPLHRHDFGRAAWLVALLLLVCAVNPNPKAFLIQPFDPAQRSMLARFTLEWKSPFDPAIASGNFHPYYEVLLAAAALAIILNLGRLPLAPAVLLAATAYLSFQSHRFRVEFALVAAPMIALLVASVPALKGLAGRGARSRTVWAGAGLTLALALVAIERDRVWVSHDVPELYPNAALGFVVENDIARRPFHPIGFGSCLMWELYGKRQTFIDGRTFEPALYRDFVAAQASSAGFRAVIEKYRLDSFILPAPARSDQGMQNVHRWLIEARADWDLVYVDDRALVYVAKAATDSTWLSAHACREYHPMTFGKTPLTPEQMAGVVADLERLTAAAPGATQPLGDLGVAYFSQRRPDDAIAAFERLAALAPGNVGIYLNLVRAHAAKGDIDGALTACDRALGIDPRNSQALQMRDALRRQLRK